MSCTCGCCVGTEALTPETVENRPGLSTLRYRVGTHASFLATMLARLSTADSAALAGLGTRDPADPAIAVLDAWATIGDVLTFYQERIAQEGYLRTAVERRSLIELARLVGYTPRPGVSASAYLAFTLESGQAATVPAGTRAQSLPGPTPGELPQPFETSEALDARAEWNVLSPRQTQPQWITMEPKNRQWDTDVARIEAVYFKGTATNLRPGDPLLFVFGDKAGQQELRFVEAVAPDQAAGRTKVALLPEVTAQFVDDMRVVLKRASRVSLTPFAERLLAGLQDAVKYEGSLAGVRRQAIGLKAELGGIEYPSKGVKALAEQLDAVLAPARDGAAARVAGDGVGDLLASLSTPASTPPANRLRLARNPQAVLKPTSDALPRLLTALRPALRDRLYPALARAQVDASGPTVYALRLRASPHGHNAPKRPVIKDGAVVDLWEWSVFDFRGKPLERPDVIDLAGSHPEVLPDSWLVIQTHASTFTDEGLIYARAGAVDATLSRADYGMSGDITRIPLHAGDGKEAVEWIHLAAPAAPRHARSSVPDPEFDEIRRTAVFAQAEELRLSEEPIPGPVCKDRIELDAVYPGLQAGRWLVVSGERADVTGVSGLVDAELVMIAGVEQDTPSTPISTDGRPRGGSRTVITLAGGPADRPGLAFCYRRPTVSIYANVAHATHGETRREVLGSGDAAKTFQELALRQSPLTFVSAPTPDGAESTLGARVSDVLWHETDGLGWAGPRDRVYVTRTDEKDKTSVRFGDGVHGLRPATGVENIRAQYRSGIGRPGNVGPGRISQLATRPLGVKGVVNPLRSSGGADPDRPDQIRRNVPPATSPLDRLVSVEDYAEFARRFAGIGKASAARLSDGHSQVVLVTIAGVDDIPIDPISDLLGNLRTAFHRFGDPYQQIQVVPRESRLLVISAGIQLLPDYEWESVEPRIRSALLAAFGFDRRELGRSVFLSEVLAAAQAVPGVAYVDVDLFDAIGEGSEIDDLDRAAQQPKRNERVPALPARRNTDAAHPDPRLLPAQLAWLTPDVPDTLLLKVLL